MRLKDSPMRPFDSESGNGGAVTFLTDTAPEAPAPQQQRTSRRRTLQPPVPPTYTALPYDHEGSNHQAELFYLQKQIQLQTRMVIVLEDGQQLQGVIEWYDRHCIKIRGRSRVLIYKSAIKYIYKIGEIGAAPGQ